MILQRCIMKSINIVECKNDSDLKEVAILAEKIWHEFFPSIISEAQIDYMVEHFQSFDAMQDQVKHQQYHYHKVYVGNELIGYIGLQNQSIENQTSHIHLDCAYCVCCKSNKLQSNNIFLPAS